MAFSLEYDAIQELKLFHLKNFLSVHKFLEVQFGHIEIESLYDNVKD